MQQRVIFPIWLLGRWRSEPGAKCLGKNRRGGHNRLYWYIKAWIKIKQRKTRVNMLAQCYKEDGHLRGEWG